MPGQVTRCQVTSHLTPVYLTLDLASDNLAPPRSRPGHSSAQVQLLGRDKSSSDQVQDHDTWPDNLLNININPA